MKTNCFLSVLLCVFLVGCTQNADELYEKGIAYYNGEDGCERNEEKALSLLTKSADKGNANAYIALGSISVINGKFKKSENYLDKAIEVGGGEYAKRVGDLFYYGTEIFPVDYLRASVYYCRAIQLGEKDSRVYCNLGVVLYDGCDENSRVYDNVGREVDDRLESLFNYENAAHFFKLAADMNDSRGLYLLGICYFWGRGVEMNQDLAIEHIARAADMGFQNAKDFMATLQTM